MSLMKILEKIQHQMHYPISEACLYASVLIKVDISNLAKWNKNTNDDSYIEGCVL